LGSPLVSPLSIIHPPSSTPPPPCSPLFPYTTLFRSRRLGRFEDGVSVLYVAYGVLRCGVRHLVVDGFRGDVRDRRGVRGNRSGRDRKSRRLNSSHVKTSHAVFCLENKSREREYADSQ